MKRPIDGFSKLPKQEKIDWLIQEYLENDTNFESVLKQYWNEDLELQKLHGAEIGRASVGKECRSRWSPYH